MRTAILIIFLLNLYHISLGQNEVNDPYIIKSIFFNGGSFEVDHQQMKGIYQLVDSIPQVKNYSISVHSYTDNIGGAAYNEWLSKMRSEAVIGELLATGFNNNLIKVKDFGQFNPVFDNNTWEGRQKNRRVDIIFWPLVF